MNCKQTIKWSLALMLFLLIHPIQAQDNNTPVPFTLADRDRILRTEQKIDALGKSINERFASMQRSVDERFDAQQKSIDERFDAMQTLLYFLLGAMFVLFGFVLWDRRTAITPVQREQKRMLDALREYAKKDENLKKIFQHAALW